MVCTNCPPADCQCPVLDMSTDCSVYDGTIVLADIGTNPGTVLTQVLININSSLTNLKNSLAGYFTVVGIGGGAQVFAGTTGTGAKKIRSIVQGANIQVSENTSDITLSVPAASDTVLGAIEIATQAEVDAQADALKVVTPLTLGIILASGSYLPIASSTARGIIEIATQAETDFGADTTRAVTPSTLAPFVANPINLPNATLTAPGISELATQTEVNTGTDNFRIVTPATLSTYVSAELANPANLPDATTTQKGVVELATAAEVNALVDTTRAITPSTIPQSSETQRGVIEIASTAESNALTATDKAITPANLPISSEIQQGLAERATQAETLAGTDDVRYVTPLKLQQKFDAQSTGLQATVVTVGTWTKNSVTSIAHNLGIEPLTASILLVNVNPVQGFVAGQKATIGLTGVDNKGGSIDDFGISVHINGTTNFNLATAEKVWIQSISNPAINFEPSVTDWDVRIVFFHL